MPQAHSVSVNLASSLSRSLSSLSSSKSPPRLSFDNDAVGLEIVAAMVGSGSPPPPPRSEPLLIFSGAAATMWRTKQPPPSISVRNWQQQQQLEEETSPMEIESSESYTCVTSYVGGKPVTKTIYFEDDSYAFNVGGSTQTQTTPLPNSNSEENSKVVMFIGSPPSPLRDSALQLSREDFLSTCYRCKQSLHGIDIFMYRGEKPFCRPECRYLYVLNDEPWDKCALEALKLFDSASSPCSDGRTAA